jgi:uncharacterized membrane protein YhfC
VFLVFSQILEKALHVYLLKINPSTVAWLQTHRLAFAAYRCLAGGLFEEVGRMLLLIGGAVLLAFFLRELPRKATLPAGERA